MKNPNKSDMEGLKGLTPNFDVSNRVEKIASNHQKEFQSDIMWF